MPRKPFDKMTKAEQRVAIAKDALKQIQAGKIEPYSGVYFFPVEGLDVYDYQSVKPGRVPKCEACAVGSLFIGKFNLANGEFCGSGTKMYKLLKRYFDEASLCAIELAFEGGDHRYWTYWTDTFPDPEDRLIAILQNIIDHKGDFKPEVEYEVYVG